MSKVISILGFAFFILTVIVVNWALKRRSLKGDRFSFLYWRLQLWPRVRLVRSHKNDVAHLSDKPRKFEGLVVPVIIVGSFLVAQIFAMFLLLCFLYGFARVMREGLEIVSMGHGRPWVISNGDKLPDSIPPLFFAMGAALWIPLTFASAYLARRFLPKQDPEKIKSAK